MDAHSGTVGWEDIHGIRCIVCRFPDHLDGATAEQMAARMSTLLTGGGMRPPMVWDARLMKSYDREAREAWQHALVRLKHHLGEIHLVTESPVVRLGATAISLVTGYEIRSCARWEQVHPHGAHH